MCAQRRLRSAWASAQSLIRLGDTQADRSLRWAHSHFVGFVMLRLNYELYLLSFTTFLSVLCIRFMHLRRKKKQQQFKWIFPFNTFTPVFFPSPIGIILSPLILRQNYTCQIKMRRYVPMKQF